MSDDAYDHGDAKRSDYQPDVCSLCGVINGHYPYCIVHGSEATA